MAATKYSFDITWPLELDPDPVNSAKPRESLVAVGKLFGQIASGWAPGAATVVCKTEGVAASGTVTAASGQNNDTVTVNGVTFTAKTSGATGDQFNLGSTDADAATNLAAAWNASATAGVNVCTASATNAIVTFTAKDPGLTGNAITLASSNGSRFAVSAARFTGGTATYTTLSF